MTFDKNVCYNQNKNVCYFEVRINKNKCIFNVVSLFFDAESEFEVRFSLTPFLSYRKII